MSEVLGKLRDADGLRLLAFTLAERQDSVPAAVRIAELATQLQPDNPGIWHSYGRVLTLTHNPEEAIAAFDAGLRLEPSNPETLLQSKAWAFHAMHDHDNEIKAYDAALGIKPGFTSALDNKSIALRNLRRFPEALATAAELIAIHPEMPEGWTNLGVAHRLLGNIVEALDAFDKSHALYPFSPDAIAGKSMCLQKLGRRAELGELMDHYAAKGIYLLENWREAGSSFHSSRALGDALEVYELILWVNPLDAETLYEKGMVLQHLQRHDEAIRVFETLIESNANLCSAWRSKAGSMTALGLLGAVDAIEVAYQLEPDNPEIWLQKGGHYISCDRLGRRKGMVPQSVA